MADLFVYGTLRFLPLLELVLGRSESRIARTDATLDGWSVHWVRDAPFPMIQQSAGARAPGLLLRGLGEEDLARLNHYEGGFDYALAELPVATATGPEVAVVYLPEAGRWQADAAFDLNDWAQRHGALTLEAAEEVMERFGVSSPAEIARLFPFIRARAWARMMARDSAPCELRRPAGDNPYDIPQVHKGFDGFFRIRSFDIRYERFDGGQSDVVTREAYVAFDAALVLPYDPVSDKVMLIEQLRYGPIWRKDPQPWVLEPIAGLIDAGEAPADTARREAGEEAGLELGDLRLMTRIYASPGYSTDFFHCYLGLCDLGGHKGGVAGLAHESEDIRNHVIPFERALALVDSGEINAGPLAIMVLWLARHRDEIRRTVT